VWVVNTRTRRGELDSDRIARLDLIGFVWNARDHQWESMFAKLKHYCRKHGDCLVPYRFEADPSLGFWVMTQRGPRKKLDSERIARLMESLSIFFESFGPTMGKCVCQA
jgi:hypothetical protein